MAQNDLRFTVQVAEDSNTPGRWTSPAFRLPGTKLTAVHDAGGRARTDAMLEGDLLAIASDSPSPVMATVEVPSDLMLPSALEHAKLDLEREKLALEEANRRRTWQWSIASALLAAAVSVAVAYMGQSDSGTSIARAGPTADAVETCRHSLKRLPLLAMANDQTVTSLAEAIRRHEADCDEVLVKVLGSRGL